MGELKVPLPRPRFEHLRDPLFFETVDKLLGMLSSTTEEQLLSVSFAAARSLCAFLRVLPRKVSVLPRFWNLKNRWTSLGLSTSKPTPLE